MVKKSSKNIIWIDLEMTGLSPEKDKVIEIATVITDSELNIVAEGPVLCIGQTQEVLEKMDAWNKKHHKKSGLYERVLASKITKDEAEAKTIDFIKEYVDKGMSPMAGNSICQDRRFLANYMPKLESWFHYRNLDVSSLKELAKRWYPDSFNSLKKNNNHIALQDIYDSINELKFYRKHILR